MSQAFIRNSSEIEVFESSYTKKISNPIFKGVYLNEDLYKLVRAKVGAKGLSSVVNQALLNWLQSQCN